MRVRQDGIFWRRIDEEIVVLDERSHDYLTVNPTGQVLWESLLEGTTPSKLTECVLDVFEIDEATAAQDVDTFLRMLDQRGLLVHSP